MALHLLTWPNRDVNSFSAVHQLGHWLNYQKFSIWKPYKLQKSEYALKKMLQTRVKTEVSPG